MAALVANTSKSEIDTRLQQAASAIMALREQVQVLSDWRQPQTSEDIQGLGYTEEQVSEMTWFIDLSQAWCEMIGNGGTMSPADGQLLERMLVQIYGLGGMAGIVTVPPPP